MKKGNALPPIDILSAYADFFKVSVDYLIVREDDFGIKKPKAQLRPGVFKRETKNY